MTKSMKTSPTLSKEKAERITSLQEITESDRTPEEVEELEGLEEEQMAAEIAAEESTEEAHEDKVNREKKEDSETEKSKQDAIDQKVLDARQNEADENKELADGMITANLNDEHQIREVESRGHYHVRVMTKVKIKGEKAYDDQYRTLIFGTRTFEKFLARKKKDGIDLLLGYDSSEVIHDPIKYNKDNK